MQQQLEKVCIVTRLPNIGPRGTTTDGRMTALSFVCLHKIFNKSSEWTRAVPEKDKQSHGFKRDKVLVLVEQWDFITDWCKT